VTYFAIIITILAIAVIPVFIAVVFFIVRFIVEERAITASSRQSGTAVDRQPMTFEVVVASIMVGADRSRQRRFPAILATLALTILTVWAVDFVSPVDDRAIFRIFIIGAAITQVFELVRLGWSRKTRSDQSKKRSHDEH